MSNGSWMRLIPLIGMLVWAAIQDLRGRRIGNELTLPLILAGLLQSFSAWGTLSPGSAFGGLGVGFGLTFILFALGGLGGGDVKLLSGVGAWIGPVPTIAVFAVAAILGLVVVLCQSIAQGRLRVLFRNSAMLAINLAHVNDVGVEHVTKTGQSCRSIDKPLPYAVPVLAAVLVVLILPELLRTWL